MADKVLALSVGDTRNHAVDIAQPAAVPCIDTRACAFFRLPYVERGFLPVWVVITNERDQPLALDEVRIQFLPYESDRVLAASDDDLNRRFFNTHRAMPGHTPIIPIPIHHEAVDAKIVNDDTDFGFKSLTVAPHSTAAGYVFYDVSNLGLMDSALKGAELYLKEISTTDEKGKKVQLFSFSIPFDKWLAAQPKSGGK